MCLNMHCKTCHANSLRGCLHDTGTSFILVRNLISCRVYMRVISLPEWHEVSCEPSFLQVILERCCLSRRHSLPVPGNSATHLQPERNLVPLLHGTWVYRIRSDFIPIGMFRTGTKESSRKIEWVVEKWPSDQGKIVRVLICQKLLNQATLDCVSSWVAEYSEVWKIQIKLKVWIFKVFCKHYFLISDVIMDIRIFFFFTCS